MYILNEISKESFHNKDVSFMKIVAAGDDTQLGYNVERTVSQYGQNELQLFEKNIDSIDGLFVNKLFTTIRSSNSQKRDNNDLLVGLNTKIKSYYDNIKTYKEFIEAQNKVQAFLKDINTITSLNYYHDDNTLNGDIILNNYNEKVFKTLKTITDSSDKNIGILTNNGIISEELQTILSKVGLISEGGTVSDKIKLFTPENIQGNEVNYFIFDTNFLNKYNNLGQKLKAFYTYMSRSKDGSVIIDINKSLENDLGLTNNQLNYTE
jgi:hypothetical protein